VAFSHFARLFGDGALPIPCAIVSDGDADPTVPDADNPRLQPKMA
jgi:predicted ATP-dependent endonuclease of OLD family